MQIKIANNNFIKGINLYEDLKFIKLKDLSENLETFYKKVVLDSFSVEKIMPKISFLFLFS